MMNAIWIILLMHITHASWKIISINIEFLTDHTSHVNIVAHTYINVNKSSPIKQLHTLSSRPNCDITCPQIAYKQAMHWLYLYTNSSHVNTLGQTYGPRINYHQACHSNSSNDNLVLKTSCGIEMPTKHSTQQAIIDHIIVLWRPPSPIRTGWRVRIETPGKPSYHSITLSKSFIKYA